MNASSDALVALGWAQLWQVTAVALGVGIIVRVTCRRRPHLAYALWAVVLVKCLTPPVWSSPTGIFSWAQLQRVEQSAGAEELGFAGMPALPESFAGPDREEATGAVTAAPALARPRAPQRNAMSRADCLVVAWLAGAALLTAWLAIKWLGTCRWLARSCVPAEPRWQALTDELCRRLGMRRSVRLFTGDASLGPAAFGILRPKVLLPAALLESKPLAQIEPILAHELMHVRRCDPAIGKLQLVAQILWWFHPLIWWANRELRRQRERACDEEVLARLGCRPGDYARSLLDVLEWRRALRPAFAFPGLRPWEVTSKRLEHIMSNSQGFHRRMPRWCWMILVAAITVVLPGAGFIITSSQSESKRPNPPASTSRWQVLMQGQLDVRSNRPLCLDISPDSSTLAVGGAGIELFDVASGNHLAHRFVSRSLTRAVKFSPTNNRLFASGSDDGVVRVWDASKPEAVKILRGHAGTVHDLAFSPDGKQLANCSTQYANGKQLSGDICIWNVDDGELVYEQTFTESELSSVAFSPDAMLLACCIAPAAQNSVSKVVVYGTGNWKPVREIAFSPGSGLDLAFTSDSSKLIIAGGICVPITETSCQPTGKVWIADLAADGAARLLNVDESQYFRSVSVTPGGDRFATGTAIERDRLSPSGRKSGWALIAQIQMRDVATGQVIWSQDGELGDPYGVTVSRDGKVVAACSKGKVLLFDAAHGALLRTVEGKQ